MQTKSHRDLGKQIKESIKIASKSVLSTVGREGAEQAKSHARSYGGRSFWNSVANSIKWRIKGYNSVSIYTSHVAAHHKQEGGIISAPGKAPSSKSMRTGKSRKYLTIPWDSCPRAKRDMENVPKDRYVFARTKKGTLIAGERTSKGGKVKWLWTLVPETKPHPAFKFWVSNDFLARIAEKSIKELGSTILKNK